MPAQNFKLDIKGIIGIVATLIYIGIGIACIVYSARLVIYSSDDYKDKKIDDFYFTSTSRIIIEEESKCQCGQKIFNEKCTNEQKDKGCYAIYYEDENPEDENYFRSLMLNNECNEYVIKFIGQNKGLNDVFELKINQIHATSIAMLVIICLSFFCLIIYFCAFCGCICCACFLKDPYQCLFCVPIFFVIGMIVGVGNLAAFITLMVFYFTGDISKYADFLDCSNVNKDKFIQDFKNLEDLRSAFITFMVLNIIGIVLNLISNCLNKKDDSSGGYERF